MPGLTPDIKHELHPASDFCLRCGKSAMELLERPQPCRGDEIFAAISHERSMARARKLYHRVLESPKCPV